MSSWWGSWFGGSSNRAAPRDAIVGLRENLMMLDKKEQHLTKKIEEQQEKARTLVSTNRKAATQALRQKKQYESELDRLAGTRMTIESQVNAIESANMNLETMQAMKRGSEALKNIHGSLDINKVDQTMDSIREQMDLTNEVSEAIANPVGMGQEFDEDELKNELEELEQDELNDRLIGADTVPAHTPQVAQSAQAAPAAPQRVEENDEEAELRALQAELAM